MHLFTEFARVHTAWLCIDLNYNMIQLTPLASCMHWRRPAATAAIF